MRTDDIRILKEVKIELGKYLPKDRVELYLEFADLCKRWDAKKNQEAKDYKTKEEYHKAYSKDWRKKNPEKHNSYQQKYHLKKKAIQEVFRYADVHEVELSYTKLDFEVA